ncbi:MAG: hypothetical protein ABMA64_08710 [Myxococcota bacterium]
MSEEDDPASTPTASGWPLLLIALLERGGTAGFPVVVFLAMLYAPVVVEAFAIGRVLAEGGHTSQFWAWVLVIGGLAVFVVLQFGVFRRNRQTIQDLLKDNRVLTDRELEGVRKMRDSQMKLRDSEREGP